MAATAERQRYTGDIVIEKVDTAEKPLVRQTVDNSQFEHLVSESWQKKQVGHQAPAVGLTVNKPAAKLVESRIRAAARTVGCGVAVEVFEHDDPRVREYALKPEQVRIKFEARPKSNRGGHRPAATEKAPAKGAKKE